MVIAIILVSLALIFVYFYISYQRKFVTLDEMVGNGASQIGVQLNSRWDALSALADVAKDYATHEAEGLKGIIAMRQGINSGSTAKEIEAQESAFSSALSRLLVIQEAYPELKANTHYSTLMADIKVYEENVRKARMVYNDGVSVFNREVRMIPGSIFASLMRFEQKEYLDTPKEKQDMPSLRRS